MTRGKASQFVYAAAASAGLAAIAGTLVYAQTQPTPSSPRPQPVSPSTPSKPSNPVTPQPTNPTNNPANPATNPNNPNQPLNPTIEPPITHQPTTTMGANAQRLFMLEGNQDQNFNQFVNRVTRLEQQLSTQNEQLLQDLGRARLSGDTNTRVDSLARVLQGTLQENQQILAQLADIRAALTGSTNTTTPGTTIPTTSMPGATSPSTTPSTTPSTNPSTTPSTSPSNNPSGPPR